MATQLKKTVKPSGGDYTSLEACLNANEQDLTSTDKYFDVEIDGDWSGGADTTAVTFHNYKADSTRYIHIYTTSSARHRGYYEDTGRYRLKTSSQLSFNGSYTTNAMYLKLTGLAIESTANTNSAIAFTFSNINATIIIDSCIFRSVVHFTASGCIISVKYLSMFNTIGIGKRHGLNGKLSLGGEKTIGNCIGIGDLNGILSTGGTSTSKTSNCYGNSGYLGLSILGGTTSTNLSNDGSQDNIIVDSEDRTDSILSGTLDYGGLLGGIKAGTVYISDFIMAELNDNGDGTLESFDGSTGTINYETGEYTASWIEPPSELYANYIVLPEQPVLTAYDTTNFTNVTAGSEDFRLVAGSDLIDVGTDLSALFTTDIAGTTRGGTWDVGVFEYTVITNATATPDSQSLTLSLQTPTTNIVQNKTFTTSVLELSIDLNSSQIDSQVNITVLLDTGTWETVDKDNMDGTEIVKNGDDIYINANGADVWTSPNDQYAATYISMVGDFDVSVRIISQENTNTWAKAGISVRNDHSALSNGYAVMSTTPGQGYSFQWDTNGDNYLDQHSTGTNVSYPTYVRMTKVGTVLTGYYSTNGTSWTQRGTCNLASINETQDVGIFVTSHQAGSLCEVYFDTLTGFPNDGFSSTLSLYSPTFSITANTSISVDSLSVSANLLAPSVDSEINSTLEVETAGIELSLLAPSLSGSVNTVINPSIFELGLTLNVAAVDIIISSTFLASVFELALTVLEPVLDSETTITKEVSTLTSELELLSPAFVGWSIAAPSYLELTVGLNEVSLNLSSNDSITPALFSMEISQYPPTINLLNVLLVYTYENKADLPADDTDLANLYTEQNYIDVESDNDVRVSNSGIDYVIQQFKTKQNEETVFNAIWNGQTNIPTTYYPVYLQVYNRISGLWEALDNKNSVEANTDFTLQGGKVDNLTNYYDSNYWLSFRVYQKANL